MACPTGAGDDATPHRSRCAVPSCRVRDRVHRPAISQPLRSRAAAGREVVGFLTRHLGFDIASTALVAPRSEAFVAAIRGYAHDHRLPLIDFAKGQRKDDLMHEYLARSDGTEQVLFIGRAQEKARVFRTERRRNPATGAAYPWVVTATAMVNQFYF